jgi:hypothetical protein
LQEIFGTRADGKGVDLFKKYGVCMFSGKLGPKEKEGDMQTPEGFCEFFYFFFCRFASDGTTYRHRCSLGIQPQLAVSTVVQSRLPERVRGFVVCVARLTSGQTTGTIVRRRERAVM